MAESSAERQCHDCGVRQRAWLRRARAGTKSSAVAPTDGAVQSPNLSRLLRIQRQPHQSHVAGQFERPIPARSAHMSSSPSSQPQMRSAAVLTTTVLRPTPSASLPLSRHRGVALLEAGATAHSRRIRCAPI
jgi:hypothetical protein